MLPNTILVDARLESLLEGMSSYAGWEIDAQDRIIEKEVYGQTVKIQLCGSPADLARENPDGVIILEPCQKLPQDRRYTLSTRRARKALGAHTAGLPHVVAVAPAITQGRLAEFWANFFAHHFRKTSVVGGQHAPSLYPYRVW